MSSISAERQAVLDWLGGFDKWDADAIAAPMSDETYVHQILPASLGIPPRQSKKEFIDYFRKDVMPMFKDFKVTIHEIVEEPGKIVAHVSSTAQSTTGYPYKNEYMITFQLKASAEGVPKITSIKEFVDSAFSSQFFKEERARIAALKE